MNKKTEENVKLPVIKEKSAEESMIEATTLDKKKTPEKEAPKEEKKIEDLNRAEINEKLDECYQKQNRCKVGSKSWNELRLKINKLLIELGKRAEGRF